MTRAGAVDRAPSPVGEGIGPVEIAARLRTFMEERFLIDDTLGPDVDLFEAGIVDSFGLIEMVAFLESDFAVSFSKQDFMSPRLSTLAGIAGLVHEKRGSC